MTIISETKHNYCNERVFYEILVYFLLFSGAFFAVWQFVFNRSLWLDEAMIANNIIERSYLELLRPLDYNQAAPILFLWIQKTLYELLPQKEMALRILPLISYLGSIFILFKIIQVLFLDKRTWVFLFLLIGLNYYFIYYASEVKQYMGDTFGTLFLYSLVLLPQENWNKKRWYLILAGVILIFYSHVAPIILFSIGIFIFLESPSFHKLKRYLPIFFTWMIAFLGYYWVFIHGHPLKDWMQDFWEKQYGFLPDWENKGRFFMFFKLKFVMIFRFMLSAGGLEKYLLLVFFLMGIVSLYLRNQWSLLALLLVPSILHFGLAVLKLYPFELRLLLYYLPLQILIIGKGFESLMVHLDKWNKKASLSAFVFLAALGFNNKVAAFKGKFPMEVSEMKATLDYMSDHIQENQSVFVVGESRPAFKFYQYISYWKGDNPVIIEETDFGEFQISLEKMKKMKGEFWLLFSQLSPFHREILKKEIQECNGVILDEFCAYDACVFKLFFNE